jgi:hypothetical protein
MFDALERFTTQYQHAIAAVGVLSTLAAVVVSLWLGLYAVRAHRSKLRALLTVTTLFPHGVAGPRFVTTEITNVGTLPLRIPFSHFRVRLPLQRGSTMFQPLDAFGHELVPKHSYPVTIQPNSSASFFISGEDELRDKLADFRQKLGILGKLRYKWLAFYVLTDDGRWFRCRLDQTVLNVLSKVH